MTEFLFRRNTVLEVLRANRRVIYRLWLQEGAKQAETILETAANCGIPVETVSKGRLAAMINDSSHQGVVLEAGPYRYSTIDEMLELSSERGEMPFLLLLDLLHGPSNIGALLRAAEACGVHGVILQDRRAPDITPQVAIYSAGAADHLLIGQVTNLVQSIKQLKEREVWIAGLDLDAGALPVDQVDLHRPIGIVVGHEGSGLRRLVREKCDFLMRLPMRGQLESLNASSAGTVALFLAWQARGFEGAGDHPLSDSNDG